MAIDSTAILARVESQGKLDRNRLATSTRLLRGSHHRDIMTLPDLPSR